MKKFLTIGALALALVAINSRPAPAWLNWKMGIGANIGWQSGGNNTLWGFFRNGQPPAPDCGGGPGCALPPGGPAYGGPFGGPSSLTPDNAAPIRANQSSYTQQPQQSPWGNVTPTNTVGYRYYYPYSYYGYGYGYNNSYYGYQR